MNGDPDVTEWPNTDDNGYVQLPPWTFDFQAND